MSFKIHNRHDTIKRLLALDYKAMSNENLLYYVNHMNELQKNIQAEILLREDGKVPLTYIQIDLLHLRKMFSAMFKRIVEIEGYHYLQALSKGRRIREQVKKDIDLNS